MSSESHEAITGAALPGLCEEKFQQAYKLFAAGNPTIRPWTNGLFGLEMIGLEPITLSDNTISRYLLIGPGVDFAGEDIHRGDDTLECLYRLMPMRRGC